MEFLKGDCLEVMKTLADKSIDCFVCDLPYGCLTGGGGKEKKRRRFQNGKDTGTEIKQTEGVIAGCSWDIKINLDLFWTQIKRLAKNDHTPVLMFCTTKFGAELIASNPDWFRYDIVWSKSNGVGFLSANKQPLRSHEMIYVFSKKGAYYKRIDIEGDFPRSGGGRSAGQNVYINSNSFNGGKQIINISKDNTGKRCVKSVVEIQNKKGKGNHPTQKPAELYEWLLKRYCPEEGTILDPTAGSFTSCFTAQKLGLKSIGIEMNEEFFGKACLLKNQ
jgi:site-specific DNA-methyltransferase (adenine-specific)